MTIAWSAPGNTTISNDGHTLRKTSGEGFTSGISRGTVAFDTAGHKLQFIAPTTQTGNPGPGTGYWFWGYMDAAATEVGYSPSNIKYGWLQYPDGTAQVVLNGVTQGSSTLPALNTPVELRMEPGLVTWFVGGVPKWQIITGIPAQVNVVAYSYYTAFDMNFTSATDTVLAATTAFPITASGYDQWLQKVGTWPPFGASPTLTNDADLQCFTGVHLGNYYLRQAHLAWDTSSLTGLVITSARLRIQVSSKLNSAGRVLEATWSNAGGSIVAADFVDSPTADAGTFAPTVWYPAGQVQTFDLLLPESVNTIGYTRLILSLSQAPGAPGEQNYITFSDFSATPLIVATLMVTTEAAPDPIAVAGLSSTLLLF